MFCNHEAHRKSGVKRLPPPKLLIEPLKEFPPTNRKRVYWAPASLLHHVHHQMKTSVNDKTLACCSAAGRPEPHKTTLSISGNRVKRCGNNTACGFKSNCFITSNWHHAVKCLPPPSTEGGSFPKTVTAPRGTMQVWLHWKCRCRSHGTFLTDFSEEGSLRTSRCFTYLIVATFLIEASNLHDCSAVLWVLHDFNILVTSPCYTIVSTCNYLEDLVLKTATITPISGQNVHSSLLAVAANQSHPLDLVNQISIYC